MTPPVGHAERLRAWLQHCEELVIQGVIVDDADMRDGAWQALEELVTLRAEFEHRPGHTCHASSDTCAGCEFALERSRRIQRLRDEVATLRAERDRLQDETWAGAVTYVRDMAKTIRSLTQRFVADGAIAELATVRAEALEECADGMERAAKKARAAPTASPEEK